MEHIEAHTMRLLGSVPARTMRSSAVHFYPGDVLYGRLRPYLNKVYRADFEGLCSAEFIVFPTAEGIDSRFLQYRLNAADFVSFASHLNEGDRPRVDFEQISQFQITVPPREEQERIVAEIEKQFTRLDAGHAALKRLQVHLQRHRSAVLLAATEGRLVPTEAEVARVERRSFEDAAGYLRRIRERRNTADLDKRREPPQPEPSRLPPLPDGWVWTNVNSVGDVLLGRRRAPEYLSSPHARPYLRVANVKDDRLVLEDLRTMNWDDGDVDKYALRAGDILVSEGQSPELVGQSAIYPGGIPRLCFQATLHRFRALSLGPSPSFAQVVFRAHVRAGVFRRAASITTNIAHLTLEKFKAAPFPLPPQAEEQRIVREAERLLSITDEAERALRVQLARAKALRSSILSAAFAGRLTPPATSQQEDAADLRHVQAGRTRSSV